MNEAVFAGVSWLVILLVVVGVVLARRGRSGIRVGGPKLALRKFHVDTTLGADVCVEIVGRATGLMAWLLTVIGVDAETSLKVANGKLLFKSASLFGQTHQVVPLPRVSSTYAGYAKSLEFLVMTVVFFVGAIVIGIATNNPIVIFLGLLFSGLCLVGYLLSKTILIAVETSGGTVLGLSFRRSLIENVPVDMRKSLEAIEVLNTKIMESLSNRPPDRSAPNTQQAY